MVRLEMLKGSHMRKPGFALWWERVKARPSKKTAITDWLRPEDWARYDKMAGPGNEVNRHLAHF